MKLWLTLAGIALLTVCAVVILPRTRSEARPEIEEKKATRTITASGSGTVKTTADVVRINVNIKSVATTSHEAADENEKKIKKIDAAVQALLIPNLKTTVLFAGSSKTAPPAATPGGMNPMGPQPKPAPDTYSASHTLEIVVKNDDAAKLLDAADRVAKALRENGPVDLAMNYTTSNFAGPANAFGAFQQGFGVGGGSLNQGGMPTGFENRASVVFQREDTTELRRKALTRAVESAMGNVRAMTDGAKVRLVEVTSISDQATLGLPGFAPLNVSAHHPTDIELTVDVTVTCSVKD